MCSPDYLGMDKNEAVSDFLKRIEHYNMNYQALDYRHDYELSFIQIFNQGERFLVNKLAGKILYKVFQVNKILSLWHNCVVFYTQSLITVLYTWYIHLYGNRLNYAIKSNGREKCVCLYHMIY